MDKVGVVIVTHNRINKLQKCLSSYETQSFQPTFLLVVDNACTDGSSEYLDDWCQYSQQSVLQKYVIHSSENLGGAGGFWLGMKHALDKDVDWIWLADDDAYPQNDCFLNLFNIYGILSSDEREQTAALCARVNDPDGLSPLHRRQIKKGLFAVKETCVSMSDYLKQSVSIDIFSFVGTAIKKRAILQTGLPRKDFFIFYDDTEYSLRIGNRGKILCIPSAVILHDSQENTIVKYSWKNFYMFRNKLFIYKYIWGRRYYFPEIMKTIYMILKFYNCTETWHQFFVALRAVKAKKMGIHNDYLP